MKKGLCECGCGRLTKLAPQTDKQRGNIKGQPQRFLSGHNGRKPGTHYWVNGYKMLNGFKENRHNGHRGNPMPEHKFIVEKHLKRITKKGELIHHINGDKTDNRLENLIICSKSIHSKINFLMSEIFQKEYFGKQNVDKLKNILLGLIKPLK